MGIQLFYDGFLKVTQWGRTINLTFNFPISFSNTTFMMVSSASFGSSPGHADYDASGEYRPGRNNTNGQIIGRYREDSSCWICIGY